MRKTQKVVQMNRLMAMRESNKTKPAPMDPGKAPPVTSSAKAGASMQQRQMSNAFEFAKISARGVRKPMPGLQG